MYKIPPSCEKVYIGQTGRCFNDRAREHALSIKNNSGGHLVQYIKCESVQSCLYFIFFTFFQSWNIVQLHNYHFTPCLSEDFHAETKACAEKTSSIPMCAEILLSYIYTQQFKRKHSSGTPGTVLM